MTDKFGTLQTSSDEAGVVTVGAGCRPDCHDMSRCHVTSHSRRLAHTRAADCGVTGQVVSR